MLNIRIFPVLAAALLAVMPTLAQTTGAVAQPGAAMVEPPTVGALGVEWRIEGDSNRNASVALAWRRTGETAWHDGLPLLRLHGEAVQSGASFHYVAPNMFAGSVFGLAPNTSYEIRLRLSDRPPLAIDRLQRVPDGRLTYRMKTPWRDGTTHVIFSVSEFLEKLAVLVPAPRAHLVKFYGILGPAAKWRPLVVPRDRQQSAAEVTPGEECAHAQELEKGKVRRRRNYTWAELMKRVWAVDVLECPRCFGRMRLMAAIHAEEALRRILECLGIPSRAPPLSPARRSDIVSAQD